MTGTFRNAPIGRKMTLIAIAAAAAGLLMAAAALIFMAYRTQLDSSRHDLLTIGELVAGNTTAALTFNDAQTATEVLATLRATPSIVRACLYLTDDETPFATYGVAEQPPCPSRGVELVDGNSRLHQRVPVRLLDEAVGELTLSATLAPLREQLLRQVGITLAILVGSLLITVPLMSRLQRVITDPVLRLGALARRVSETSDYSMRVPDAGRDEIGQLTRDFNAMLEQIERSNAELLDAQQDLASQVEETQAANHDLERTMEQLRETQAQLVQTEKLASLGGLVAGVAHEINTPVGVGVTAASTLRSSAETLRSSYETNNLKRSDLSSFIDLTEESTRIILSNLQRASDLVQSFKQVAVDQSSSERRVFDLHDYVDEVLLSLTPRLKKTPHQMVVDIPPGLMVDSYPGALAQILTNLVGNALLHAFDDGRQGTCTITGKAVGGDVELVFSDDGVGMPPDHARRIFDPFFTTKRGSGGSGLGMHIVYNLMSQMLHGCIRVDSTVGQGTRFTLTFPTQVPAAGESIQ